MTKHHEERTRFARWWAVVTLWLAIVVIAFSAVGCAATDKYAEIPPQSPAVASLERELSESTWVGLKNCVTTESSGLRRHSYEISFEVETINQGMVERVVSKGSRLDGAALETCMLGVLRQMSVIEYMRSDSFSHELQSQSLSSRAMIGNTAALPQLIRLVPIVLTAPGGITIVVAVAIVVVVAVIIDNEKEAERERCRQVNEACQQKCLPTLRNSDFGNQFHRCMRECREAAGCWKAI